MIQHIWRNIKVRTKFLFILTLAMLLVLSGVLATFRIPSISWICGRTPWTPSMRAGA